MTKSGVEGKGRGRPRLTDEEKAARQAAKAAKPKKRRGPKTKAEKAKQQKPAPTVFMAAAADEPHATGEVPPQSEDTKPGVGNPGKFTLEMVEEARAMATAGFTDIQMFEHLGIGRTTFYRWKKEHPEFREAIKVAKEEPDNQTERSLFHRANGFEWTEEVPIKLKDVEYDNGRKVRETERVQVVLVKKTVPPDTTAQIFWLKNRRPDLWRDKKELSVETHEDALGRLAAMAELAETA